ncbi:hypothetical protein AB0M34_34400 [Nocardia sp. NPDC050193]
MDLTLRLEIDTPQKLAPYLHNINTGLEKQALADQVVERILQEDVSTYNILRDAQNELRRGGAADSDTNKRIKELYFDFIFKWNELEGIIRGAIRSRREPIPMAEAIRYAFDGKLLNSEVHPLIQYLRMRRNQYVHSDSFPDVERLRSDLDMLIRVLETIDRMK